ncbi:MAG TPA: hypothetical protein VFT65_04675 [Candidatus Angelobacter sp.]|nr:hypothetical protein [Candidatus Angelobacter sp.]
MSNGRGALVAAGMLPQGVGKRSRRRIRAGDSARRRRKHVTFVSHDMVDTHSGPQYASLNTAKLF